jgi:ComF family protein
VSVSKRVTQALRVISQALFFPQACVLCHRWVLNPDWSPLCQGCFARLEPLGRRICYSCGIPLPGDVLGIHGTCSQCRAQGNPFDFARAYGSYRGELRSLIIQFKFGHHQRLTHPLATLLQTCYERSELDLQPDWIVPVPPHVRRRRKRGFDQTLTLSRVLSQKLNVPVFPGLSRIKPTAPQSGLDLRQRRKNLRNAFRLSRPERLSDQSIVLVDDVMTTGTTISEVCRLLRMETSIHTILVLTVARVPLVFRSRPHQ